MLTRRVVLAAGAAAGLTGCARSGTTAAPRARGAPTSSGPTPLTIPARTPSDAATQPVPPPGPVDVVRGELVSRRRLGARTSWGLVRPHGVGGPLPLVVALHGHGGSVDQLFGPDLRLPRYVAAAVGAGVPPFTLVAVTGGNGFWHEQPNGDDSGAMVVDELLPLLARRRDLAVRAGSGDRIGLLGWSMGGYGVLHLGGLLGPDRVAAVCASSPGIFLDLAAAEPLPGAFADQAAFDRFSVVGRQAELAGIPVRLTCGTSDFFYPATRTYADGFPPDADLTVAYGDGGHELDVTRRALPDDLAFVAERLT